MVRQRYLTRSVSNFNREVHSVNRISRQSGPEQKGLKGRWEEETLPQTAYCTERFVKPTAVLRLAGGALALVRLFSSGLRFLLDLPLRGEPLREPEVGY